MHNKKIFVLKRNIKYVFLYPVYHSGSEIARLTTES